MAKKREPIPQYVTVIGAGTEVTGSIRFVGGLHVDGKVSGDVSAGAAEGCALTLGEEGVVEGNLDVGHVLIDGTVIGDVRASRRAELASRARIEGTLYYGVLEMAEGAEVNGKLVHIADAQPPRLLLEASGSGARRAQGPGRGDAERETGLTGEDT